MTVALILNSPKAWADGQFEPSQGSDEQVAPKMSCLAVSSLDMRSNMLEKSIRALP
jgi:hypothetical protein